MSEFKRNFIIRWDDLRTRFFAEVENKAPISRFSEAALGVKARWRTEPEYVPGRKAPGAFYGASLKQTVEWTHNGYTPPEFAHAAGYMQKVMQGDWVYNEEGENVDVAAALSGDDEPFVDWQEAPTRPGLAITIELAFLASTRAEVIAEYGAWVAGMLATFEEQGIDLAVDVELPSGSGLVTSDSGSKNQMTIRVKQPGEISGFQDWSVLFAPSGFRTLGFLTRAMACEEWQVVCSTGFGQSYSRPDWDAEYDEGTRHLRILRPPSPRSFDASKLTEKIRSFGLLD